MKPWFELGANPIFRTDFMRERIFRRSPVRLMQGHFHGPERIKRSAFSASRVVFETGSADGSP
jgi:hypothetical protein